MLLSYHNLYFFLKMMRDVRQAIKEDKFTEFKKEFLNNYNRVNQ